MMITYHEIMSSTDKEWLRSLLATEPPAGIRIVARRLFELGEKDFALGLLLDQMNRYKDPSTPTATRTETCPAAIRELGRLGDMRAIPDLIEAMDIYTVDAAFALSLLKNDELRISLEKISNKESMRGIGAILSLGFMGDLSVFDALIDIFKNEKKYIDTYRLDKLISPWYAHQLLYVIGSLDSPDAEKFLLENLTRHYILWLLLDYAFEEDTGAHMRRTVIGTFGWRIVKKLGWEKFIKKPEIIHMLRDGNRPRWEKEENELIDLLWLEVKKKLKRGNNEK